MENLQVLGGNFVEWIISLKMNSVLWESEVYERDEMC